MKIKYEKEHDIHNIEFSSDKVHDTVEEDGIIIDYSKEGEVVSVEILDASSRMRKKTFEVDLPKKAVVG